MSRGFRVWDKQTKSYEWDREFVLSPSGELMELNSNHNGTWEYRFADTNRFIIEQDTGLKDKNGERICEGDIVKFDCGDQTPAEVVYEAGSYFLRATDDGSLFYDPEANKPCPLGWFRTWGLEVIGNIHENPELLIPSDAQLESKNGI